MFKALGMLWTGLSVFFMAFEQFAKALLSLCTAGAEMAGEFEDEARMERIAKRQSKEAAMLLESTPTVAIAAPKRVKEAKEVVPA